MEKPNRAERRRSRFGGGRATEHGGWPTHLPNPVFSDAAGGTADEGPENDHAAETAPETGTPATPGEKAADKGGKPA